jgi:hypothetical protein
LFIFLQAASYWFAFKSSLSQYSCMMDTYRVSSMMWLLVIVLVTAINGIPQLDTPTQETVSNEVNTTIELILSSSNGSEVTISQIFTSKLLLLLKL